MGANETQTEALGRVNAAATTFPLSRFIAGAAGHKDPSRLVPLNVDTNKTRHGNTADKCTSRFSEMRLPCRL